MSSDLSPESLITMKWFRSDRVWVGNMTGISNVNNEESWGEWEEEEE